MDVENAVVEIKKDLLPAPPQALNHPASQSPRRLLQAAARDMTRIQRDVVNGSACNVWRKRSHYGLDFR
jgi:hypothetical protein